MRLCVGLAVLGLTGLSPDLGAADGNDHATGNRTPWQSIGPAPPSIPAAIAAHAPSHTVYIGSLGGGVLKSTDGGATFAAVNNGLDRLTISAMAMAPNDPDVVYVSTQFGNIHKTTDGAATWNDMGEGFGVVSLVMDPANSDILYAGGAFGGVIKTVDGGKTWEGTGDLGEQSVFSLTINPFNPNVVYAGTTGDGAFESVDGAASWTPIDIESTVWSLLVDPSDGNIVYAGSDGNGVYKSIDGGNSFARVGSPGAGAVLSLARSGNKLYAGTAPGGVSVSEDGGRTWKNTRVSKGLGLTLSVDSTGAVYLGTNVEGAFKRPADAYHNRTGKRVEDLDGRHGDHDSKWRRLAWKQLKDCACQNGHAVAIDPSDHKHVFFTTNDGGLLVTEDGGQHWQDGGLGARAPRGVAFDPQQPRRVYVGSVTGGGLYRSEDHGKHWERRQFGPSTIYTSGVSVDPIDHSVYVSTATFHGNDGIWKSTDYGDTFTRIDRAPDAPFDEYLGLRGRGITVDPHNHTTVFFAGNGIWRSQDAGASWVNVYDIGAFSVTVDPTDSYIVYASTADGSVLKSTDGGASFTPKSNGLPVGEFQTSRTGSVQVSPNDHNLLYVGTEGGGVFRSTDGAEAWLPINLGLDDLSVFGLALDPVNPNILYVSTNSSVHKTKTAGE
jgi:photosystem II stability/assembly factor-like uncharacterized protein